MTVCETAGPRADLMDVCWVVLKVGEKGFAMAVLMADHTAVWLDYLKADWMDRNNTSSFPHPKSTTQCRCQNKQGRTARWSIHICPWHS